MICEKFEALSPQDRIIFIGKLVHAVQSDNALFSYAQDINDLAKEKKLFDNVKILPDHPQQQEVKIFSTQP